MSGISRAIPRFTPMRIKPVPHPAACRMVKSLLASPEVCMSAHDIYAAAVRQFYPQKTAEELAPILSPPPPPKRNHKRDKRIRLPVPQPPNPDHPIPSMRYLKKVVLEHMAKLGEVEKVHVRKDGGGQDEEGNPLDSIRAPGAEREVIPTILDEKKEAWLWRLKPENPFSPLRFRS